MKYTIPLSAALLTSCVYAQNPAPLTNDAKWAYEGCYSSPPGHILDWFKIQSFTTAPTIESCLSTCTTRFAALGAGSCYCAELIPATLQSNPDDSNCTFACTTETSEACGGPIDKATLQPSALSLYDSQPPAPVTYPGWKYDGCVERFSSIKNLTHAATVGMITVEGCLSACDMAGLKYVFAGLSRMSCYCATSTSIKPPEEFVDNNVCSTSCLGNVKESCGGLFTEADPAVAFYERENGPADPKATEVFSGVIMTRTTSATSVSSKTTAAGGNGGDGGGVTVATGSGTGTKTATLATGSSAADSRIGSLESSSTFGVFSLLVGLFAII